MHFRIRVRLHVAKGWCIRGSEEVERAWDPCLWRGAQRIIHALGSLMQGPSQARELMCKALFSANAHAHALLCGERT